MRETPEATLGLILEHARRDYSEDGYVVFSSNEPLPIGSLIPQKSSCNAGVKEVLKECRWLITGAATSTDRAKRDGDYRRYWYRAVPTD